MCLSQRQPDVIELAACVLVWKRPVDARIGPEKELISRLQVIEIRTTFASACEDLTIHLMTREPQRRSALHHAVCIFDFCVVEASIHLVA